MDTTDALDLGDPVVADGVCPRCSLGGRPLWAHGEHRVACATCCARLYPDRPLAFRAGGIVTVGQHRLPGLTA